MRLTLRDYLRILLKWKMVVVITFCSAMVFTVVGLQFKIPEYQSQVKIKVTLNADSTKAVSSETNLVDTECEVVMTYPIIKRAVAELKYHQRSRYYILDYCPKLSRPFFKWSIDTAEKINQLLNAPGSQPADPELVYQQSAAALLDNLKVKPITNTDLFSIFVVDYDAAASARIANMISHVYILLTLKNRLAELTASMENLQNPKLIDLRRIVTRMENNLADNRMFTVDNLGFSNAKIVEAAMPPVKPKGLPKVVLLVLAAVGGTMLGFALVVVFERFDDTVRGPEDIEAHFNLPLLGSLPKSGLRQYRYNREMNAMITPKKAQAAYENLAMEIYWQIQERKLKVVYVASALPNREIAPIIASIGTALAATKKTRVLILDANLRNPSLHKLFGIVPSFNLDHGPEETEAESVIQKITDHLSILPSAASQFGMAAVQHSKKMRKLISDCKADYDVILLNSSSMIKNNDGLVLSSMADEVVYVINEGRERRQAIATALAALQNKNKKIMGIVLNNRSFIIPKLLIKWL